ncbi:hypothetical protein [Streptomyces exfoliatus]|uniref:hypothetical protein n=1 Tax=Streptomyces exfoliatus TaxID=1905 RepID=UPI003C2E11D0
MTTAKTRSKYTLLLDQDAALTLDQLALDLRRHCGRPVDKSEILRTLIRLTATNPLLSDALAAAFSGRSPSTVHKHMKALDAE